MANALTFDLKGLAGLLEKLAGAQRDLRDRAGAALRQEAEIEMTESKQRVPVDTGALRASGHVQPVRDEGGTLSVTLAYGGPSVDYAVTVHEDLEAFHRVGEAKYLENVLKESAPHMAERIARRLKV